MRSPASFRPVVPDDLIGSARTAARALVAKARRIRTGKEGPMKIINNGHTIQVNVAPGSKLRIDGKPFELLQFHFHRPSEEHIDGKPSAMVIHFVHKNEAGELAVLGVLLKEGNENPGLKTLWAHAPAKEGPEVTPNGVVFNPANLLPRELEFYSYDGSLTTPPCTDFFSARWGCQ